jgi:SRSO17 transposase
LGLPGISRAASPCRRTFCSRCSTAAASALHGLDGQFAIAWWNARDGRLTLPSQAWRTLKWREGTNQTLRSRFAALRVRAAHRDYKRHSEREEE